MNLFSYDNPKFDIQALEFTRIEPILEMNNVTDLLFLDRENMVDEEEIKKYDEFEKL